MGGVIGLIGREKDPLVIVEDEGNGGGFGDKGREKQCWGM